MNCKNFEMIDNKKHISAELYKDIHNEDEENKTHNTRRQIEERTQCNKLIRLEIVRSQNSKVLKQNDILNASLLSTLDAQIFFDHQNLEQTLSNLEFAEMYRILLASDNYRTRHNLISGPNCSRKLKTCNKPYVIETNIIGIYPKLITNSLKANCQLPKRSIFLNKQVTANDYSMIFFIFYISNLYNIYLKKRVLSIPSRIWPFLSIIHGCFMKWLLIFLELPVLSVKNNQNIILATLPLKVVFNFDIQASWAYQSESSEMFIKVENEWYTNFPVVLLFNGKRCETDNLKVTTLIIWTVTIYQILSKVEGKSNDINMQLTRAKFMPTLKKKKINRIKNNNLMTILNTHKKYAKVQSKLAKPTNRNEWAQHEKLCLLRFHPILQQNLGQQITENLSLISTHSNKNLLYKYKELDEKSGNAFNSENDEMLSSNTLTCINRRPEVNVIKTNLQQKRHIVTCNSLNVIACVENKSKILSKTFIPYYIFMMSSITRLAYVYSKKYVLCPSHRTWSFEDITHGYYMRWLLIFLNLPVLSPKCNQILIISIYPFKLIPNFDFKLWILQNKYTEIFIINEEEWYQIYHITFNKRNVSENFKGNTILKLHNHCYKMYTKAKYRSSNIKINSLIRKLIAILNKVKIQEIFLNSLLNAYRNCIELQKAPLKSPPSDKPCCSQFRLRYQENEFIQAQPNPENDIYESLMLFSIDGRPFCYVNKLQETSINSDVEGIKITGNVHVKKHQDLNEEPKYLDTLKHKIISSTDGELKRQHPIECSSLMATISAKRVSNFFNKNLFPDLNYIRLFIQYLICNYSKKQNDICIPYMNRTWYFKNMTHGFLVKWFLKYTNFQVLHVKYNQTLVIIMAPYNFNFNFDTKISWIILQSEIFEICNMTNTVDWCSFPIILSYTKNKSEPTVGTKNAKDIIFITGFSKLIKNIKNATVTRLFKMKPKQFSNDHLYEFNKFNTMLNSNKNFDDMLIMCSHREETWFTKIRQTIKETKDAVLETIFKANEEIKKTSSLQTHAQSLVVNLVHDSGFYKVFLKRLGKSLINTFFNFVDTDF